MDVLEVLSSLSMLLCSIFGVICALIFIVIVILHRRFWTMIILLAFNSAIAGLIINIVCANQAVYQLESDGNNRLCAFRGFLLHAASGLLYQTVCVQTIHRLFVVVFSTRRYLQSKQMMIFITISQWLISITFAIPALIFGRIVSQPGSRICQILSQNKNKPLFVVYKKHLIQQRNYQLKNNEFRAHAPTNVFTDTKNTELNTDDHHEIVHFYDTILKHLVRNW
ncbi:unnamed protein product [Adineta ricciae]|uniref:Uncharacterized protein n=1 Tax=Adineta ricciae TaxID=249248 RepID=A0A815V6X7_ADIRI|nr:unnamed protein product [Adineta ricciae]